MKTCTSEYASHLLFEFSALLIVLLWGLFPQLAHSEPKPPDVFNLLAVGVGKTTDWRNVEAVLKSNINSDAELEISADSAARFVSGGRKKSFKLQRGKAEMREKMEINVADGKEHLVKVKLRLVGADGKPWLILEREMRVSKAAARLAPSAAVVSADDERVPIVHVLPDGTKVVERMSRKEAKARGLPENRRPEPSFR